MTTREPRELGAAHRALFDAWWLVEHLLGEDRIRGPVATVRASVRERMDAAIADRAARVIDVERRRDLSPEEFRSDYFRRARPVVLEGFAAAWPAVEKWSFDWLRETYGGERVCITDTGEPDFVQLAAVLPRIEAGTSRTARFGTLLTSHPELGRDLDLDALDALRPPLASTTSLQFFVAGASSVTPLHADGTCNFHVQLRGEKVWRIIEPRFNPVMQPLALSAPHFKSPLAPFDVGRVTAGPEAHIEVLEAVLRPGDVLFNPSFYWHEVRYRAPSVSVGTRWFSPTSFLHGSVAMTTLMLLARDPPVWSALLDATRGAVKGFYR